MSDSAMLTMPASRALPAGPASLAHAQKLDIAAVPRGAWEALCAASIEPNVFFDPGYAVPAATMAAGGKGADALVAFDTADHGRMLGLLPVTSAWHAYKLPIPALVALQPYSPLSTPLLEAEHAIEAAGALIDGAAATGAHLLVLPDMMLDGPVAMAFQAALAERGLSSLTDHAHQRAAFDATITDTDDYLRASMGAKRLKEMRRLRNRLADDGEVVFSMARSPLTIAPALERFLALEARGWKGNLGTGLGQSQADTAFITAVARDLGTRGAFEVAELTLNGATIAAGLVLRQGDRAFFFKIAYDEDLARVSPGVQLTLELTKRFAANPAIALVDSTAAAGHPMIDHVWRERLSVGDLLIPTRPHDPAGPALGKLIIARRHAREEAKRLVRFIASIREKKS
ncbi:CelD/BcsL family acetyltransferase involved in cellulose biosynthesis [Devosia sp. UYZn731]|uniref:GNAT family N-acetyltransferase n=1 Tax=Devosia sp. UYZn731 TaxID=3156345 RepID=UPI0033941A80